MGNSSKSRESVTSGVRWRALSARWQCAAALLLLIGLAASSRADEPALTVRLHGEAVLRFATVDEGTERLRKSDAFTQALSRFDRQVRLASDGDVTEEDVLRHAAAQVVAWSDDEVRRVTMAAESLRKRLEPFRVPLPAQVLLIQTNGKEEGEAAYCRYPAVILPRKVVAGGGGLERLLAHELFHIVSRHDPRLRARLYALIGFQACSPIVAPAALADRKLTNPDAPLWDNVISLEVAGRKLTATPILFASVEKFDPQAGGSLFKYLQFRMLVVERAAGGEWTAKLDNAKPELLNPKEIDDFQRQIGRNTGYIIHPDEILADNFAHLVLGKEGLPNPEILERMRQAFSAPAAP